MIFNLTKTLKDVKKYKKANFSTKPNKKKPYTNLGFFEAMRKTLPPLSVKNIKLIPINKPLK